MNTEENGKTIKKPDLNKSKDSKLDIYKKRLIRKVKNFVLTPIQKDIWISALMSIILVTAFVSIYEFGYQRGASQVNKEDNINRNSIESSVRGITPTVGLVVDISDNSITIDSNNGKRLTISINEKTKISSSGLEIELDKVKKDDKVTVYTTKSNNNILATRIVINKVQ